jgi:hypothetical protein
LEQQVKEFKAETSATDLEAAMKRCLTVDMSAIEEMEKEHHDMLRI